MCNGGNILLAFLNL